MRFMLIKFISKRIGITTGIILVSKPISAIINVVVNLAHEQQYHLVDSQCQ